MFQLFVTLCLLVAYPGAMAKTPCQAPTGYYTVNFTTNFAQRVNDGETHMINGSGQIFLGNSRMVMIEEISAPPPWTKLIFHIDGNFTYMALPLGKSCTKYRTDPRYRNGIPIDAEYMGSELLGGAIEVDIWKFKIIFIGMEMDQIARVKADDCVFVATTSKVVSPVIEQYQTAFFQETKEWDLKPEIFDLPEYCKNIPLAGAASQPKHMPFILPLTIAVYVFLHSLFV